MVNSQWSIVNSRWSIAGITFQPDSYRVSNLKLAMLACCLFVGANAHAQSEKQVLSRSSLFGQKDSSTITNITKSNKLLKDSTVVAKVDTPIINTKPKHDPRIATRRSLYFPGLGQMYNREYWKLPIVYGAIAIPTYTYIFNDNYYKELRFAYEARYKAALGATAADSTDYYGLDPIYKRVDVASIQSARNAARKNRDYSILWFFIVWGLNVADATVFGHLKNFDVSNDLALTIKPTFNPTTKGPGVSLVVSYKTPTHKMSSILSK